MLYYYSLQLYSHAYHSMGECNIYDDCKLFLKADFRSNEDIIYTPTSHPNVEEGSLNTQETVWEDFVNLDRLTNTNKDLVTSMLRNLDDIITDVTDKAYLEKENDEPLPLVLSSIIMESFSFHRQYALSLDERPLSSDMNRV